MAKALLLSASLCLVLLFNGCLARSDRPQNQCQFDRLQAREPDNHVQSEGGIIESWNPQHKEFQCAGVALLRLTIQPNGLHLPSYTNAPQLIHIVRGQGVLSVMFPGCPETFEESQQGQGRQGQQGRQSRRDRHQKIRHIREGDIVAIPAGVAYWSYNNGNEPLVAINLLHVVNNENQLDQNPRRFYLAGNPQDEFDQQQQYRVLFKRGEGQQSEGNNVFSGFDDNFLQEAFQVNAETARKIQNRDDNRGAIIRVEGKLDFVGPPRSQQERQGEERREEEQQREREHSRRQGDNGIEETFCTMRLRENIGDPSRADIYSPQAGRLTTANRYNLPILSWLQLSAERGYLYNNGMYVPHYNINANSVIYVIRGRARVQVVDDNGNSVFDGEVRQGQVLTVPQNFAVVKRAESEEGFEWVAFKTNDVARVHPLAGRISYIWALPEDVIANAYQISNEQARNLKYNRQESSLFRTCSI
ncbi:hypothetical protein UlMin_031643 [Ulmus minor]